MVSIVMPAYNCEKYISKAINSVIAQSVKDWELLVVDDGSTDATCRIVEAYEKQDSRIHLIRQKENGGVAKARNKGILCAAGEQIALLDSDDVWTEDKLQKQLALQKDTKAELVYCSYDFIDESDRCVGKPFCVPKETDYKKMLVQSVISCSTALIDADVLKKHLFQTDYYHEDYLLWMELLQIPIKAVGCPEVLAHYRQVTGSRSNNKRHAAKQRWIIYRKALKIGKLESLKYFWQYAVHGILKYVG